MNRKFIFAGLFFAVAMIAINSCDLIDNKGQIPVTENKYLISKTLVYSYPEELVKAVMTKIEGLYSDAAGLSNNVKYGVFVYKINYKTTYKNQVVVASGLVCVPMGTGKFPLLSFQNGTNTLHSDAPSVAFATDSLYALIESVSSFGFIVAMPDYLGFGASESMYHPYLLKESAVQTVTDMFRAIKEMMADYPTTSLSSDTYLMGYSQGGWATMALKKEIENNLSGEFTLKASSCGAGPYDLTLISNKILAQTTYPMPYFMAYIINSYIKSGEITITYTDIFNPIYSSTNYISNLFDGTRSSGDINSKLTTTISELFSKNFRDSVATGVKYKTLRDALVKNSVTAWKTTSPTLIVHGSADTFVTPEVSVNIYSDFVAKGTSTSVVTFYPIPLLDHTEAVIPWGLLTMKFLLKIKG